MTRVRLCVALLCVVGCILPSKPRAAHWEILGAVPTSVWSAAILELKIRWDSDAYFSPEEFVRRVQCEQDFCTAHWEPWGRSIFVESTRAETVDVVVELHDGATKRVQIPFREPTKIEVTRSLAKAPAGTMYASLLAEKQRWFPTLFDAEGVELWSEDFELTAGQEVADCGYDDFGRFACDVGSFQTGSFTIGLRHHTLEWQRIVTVVDAKETVEAEIVECVEHGLTPVDQQEIACAPIDPMLVRHSACPREHEVGVFARLRLRDGTVAIGGQSQLKVDYQINVPYPPYDGNPGLVTGRFGDQVAEAPFRVESSGQCWHDR